MPSHLTVFLLLVRPDRRLFYPEFDGAPDDPPPARGVRGWLERVFRRVSDGWQHPRGSALRLAHRVWHWLHDQRHPDEALYARLRTVGSVGVAYPAAMSAAAAESAWRDFLARGRRRHWPWLVVDALLSPFTVLLAPLPGPNLIGYWFVYRAVHHLFILHGLRRVRAGRLVVEFRPEPALDTPVELDAGAGPQPVRDVVGDRDALGEFLERQRAWAPPGVTTNGVGHGG